ncbi:MAG: GTP-sensing pleiotropic transcriptional regulator CodY, partial [Bacillota bacterium]|nr:GTP-sensing pleiotropic transcriptional regulator CodY [Bacillota bacterium]
MSNILEKVRKLNWLLQESPTGAFSFSDMCEILSDLMDANVYVCNARGKVIG